MNLVSRVANENMIFLSYLASELAPFVGIFFLTSCYHSQFTGAYSGSYCRGHVYQGYYKAEREVLIGFAMFLLRRCQVDWSLLAITVYNANKIGSYWQLTHETS